MVFGQVVIGPPGSGKTTYCEGMVQYLTALGRQVAVINLDPANEELPYTAAADIRDLISLEAAAEQNGLGPNGALIYCYEYLVENMDWLDQKLEELAERYVLFDMPGQIELYTCHTSVQTVVQRLMQGNHRLAAVHLVDAHHCADAAKFISVLLVTLSTMVMLEMPQVNVLSKVDMIEAYGNLDFALDFYTDVLDPSRLLPRLQAQAGEDEFGRQHAKLNARICELVDDFSLVNFATLNISDKDSVSRVLASIDKANGYVFGSSELGADASVFTCAAGVPEWDEERVGTVQERYMRDDDLSELLQPGRQS